MQDDSSHCDIIDEIADEYLRRQQAGDNPSIDEYCRRYPEHEEEIRSLLGTIGLANELLADPSTPSSDSIDAALADRSISGYEIIRRIGRGGMGVVYEAKHQTLQRHVALKVMLGEHPRSSTAAERFQREARAIANLHHTNIVPLFEVGEDNGRSFLAMQLINGPSVYDLLVSWRESDHSHDTSWDILPPQSRDGDGSSSDSGTTNAAKSHSGHSSTSKSNRNRPFHSVVKIGLQIAEALHYAHQRGVLHRDVKPSNILLDEDGVAWLTDFGLAKMDDEDLTHTGDLVGTLRYMAPERFTGHNDARSDVYSLGLTIYELLSKQPAFGSTDRAQMVHSINHVEPEPLRALNPRIPRDLETIVLTAIDKEPRARYKAAKALAEDLGRYLSDQPIQARRHSILERCVRWGRRNRGLAASLVGIALLSLLVILGLAWTTFNENRLRIDAEFSQQRGELLLGLAEERQEELEVQSNELLQQSNELRTKTDALDAQSAELRRLLYFTEMNLAGRSVGRSGSTRQLTAATDRWHPDSRSSSDDVDLRGWEWYFLRSIAEDDALELKTPRVSDAAWSPDDQFVVLAHGGDVDLLPRDQIRICDAGSGELVRLLQGHDGGVIAVDWSAATGKIASGSKDQTVRIWDPDTGECQQVIGSLDGWIWALRWDHQGKRLAWTLTTSGPDRVFVMDTSRDDAEPRELFGLQGKMCHGLQWSPDGKQLAATTYDMYIWDVESAELVGEPRPTDAVQWHDQGHDLRRMFASKASGEIEVLDLEEKSISIFAGHSWRAPYLSLNADGSQLLSAGLDHTARTWEIGSGLLRNFQMHHSDVQTTRWNHKGDKVLSGALDGTTYIWESRDNRRIVLNSGRTRDLSWHPDSNRLAAACEDGKLRIWDVDRRQLQKEFEEPSKRCCAWSPDGKQLAFSDGRREEAKIWNEDGTIQSISGGAYVVDLHWRQSDSSLLCSTFSTVGRVRRDQQQDLDVTNIDLIQIFAGQWHPREKNQCVVCDNSHEIKVYDLDANRIVQLFVGHQKAVIYDVAWSPSGDRLASAGKDGTVRIWDSKTAATIHVLKGHANIVNKVRWSPSGDRLASCGNDGTVRIWETDGGALAMVLSDHVSAVETLAWSPNGRRIASGGRSGKIFVWDASAAYDEEK